MIKEITSQIHNIDSSLNWIKQNRPADFDQKFIQLVECRRGLKKILNAAANNPGIAAFGKSQVGKSYLIGCLLQGKDANGKGVPFKLKSGDREYIFSDRINPPSDEGGGRESTGVVTRFTSFKRNPERYNPELPVLVNLFSITDIILILLDSYFYDFSDWTALGESESEELCNRLEAEYRPKPRITDPVLTADDILNMKHYFLKHLNQAQALSKSKFFDSLALIIDRIPAEDYSKVFSILWRNNETFTRLFDKLFDTLRKFDFAKSVYLPIESVVHAGVPKNTIMSVQCLKQLFENGNEHTTDVYVRNGSEFVKKASGLPKSEICAVCSEVVFKIDDDFLRSERPYEYEFMDEAVKRRITHDPVRMEILENNDLLDFPGARAREQEKLSKLSTTNMLDFFLRGKVAYLFNKYNEEMGINILLYCHHNKDNDVTNLYQLLEDWVNNYVGETVEERRRKIEMTKKSPLFYVGTMFNLDMVAGRGTESTRESIDQKWIGRFDTVVNNQCLHRKTSEWVRNWTGNGVNFLNSYVLRDYSFSQALYEGFDHTGRETAMKMDPEFYSLMRKTFIENEHVKNLFEDPAMSWDVAASQNNDGALYIIENLGVVASSMDAAREDDFKTILNKTRNRVHGIMKDYFVATDVNDILEDNIRKAKAIFREMDFTCNSDNYYFGHLLQGLQLNETTSYRVIHSVMQSPEINDKVNDFKDYEIIRNSCKKAGHPIEECRNDEEKWKCLIETYGFSSKEEASDFLSKRNIDIRKLFDGSFKRKLNSCIIADAVYDKWKSQIKSVDFLNEFSGDENFDSSIMSTLVDDLILTANSLALADIMASSIAEYVNVVNIHTANENLLADMLASLINDFVMDFGFKYLSVEEVEKARKICENRKIPAFNYIRKELPAVFDEEDLTALFNRMSSNPQALLPSFDDNYNKWIEYMFISFVAHLDVPEFDEEANRALSVILGNIMAA